MTSRTTGARHRAAHPLVTLAHTAAGNAANVGRRTAVVAASSGLLVSLMGAAPATAAPASNPSAVSNPDFDALSPATRAALVTAPPLTVAVDASWTVEQATITVTPAPEPEPEPEPVRAAPTSRSAERASTPAAAPQAATTKAPAAAAAIPASANGSAIIDAASRYVGVPYVSGGTTPSGFDCSGFTSYVFAQVGINLPRTSGAQRDAGTVVSRDQARPGDLIWTPGHIAIYAGGNTQIDAPRPGKSVQFRDIWQSNPTFIRVG